MEEVKRSAMKQFAKQGIGRMKESIGIESSTGSISQSSSQSPINWHDFNYPPVMRLYHYSTVELNKPFARLSKMMHACVILILINTLLNCKI